MTQHALLKSETITPAEKLAWLRLARTENIGPVNFHRLIQSCGSASAALEALPELSKRGGRKNPLKAADAFRVEKEYEALCKIGGEIITAAEEAYPAMLAATDDAPPVISVLGNAALMTRSCIAMVGARNASLNGKKFAEKLARDLGSQGQIVVSGLARGIDTAAHKGSLSTGTIAVVAGGIDIVYPEENKDLYREITERGLVVAESPLGVPPVAQSFPRRNRIVSGLSRGTVVVEATFKSGSLITARLAGEQGREVFAVPSHPFDPRAQGPNHLIREGATLARNAEDVLEALLTLSGQGFREPAPRETAFGDTLLPANDIPQNAQETVLAQLSFTPVTVDELVRSCHLTIPVLQTILLELELAGRIKRTPGNRISLLQEE